MRTVLLAQCRVSGSVIVLKGIVPDGWRIGLFCMQLIRVCGQHGQTFNALGVYEWMKAPRGTGGAGLCPSVYTYTAAMRAALAGNVLEKALQIWTDVEASNCTPDSRLCTAYIEVHCNLSHLMGNCGFCSEQLYVHSVPLMVLHPARM